MKRPITLSDIARAAKVSLGTASNAFNRPDSVRPALKARVEAAAQQLGYAGPDPRGRLLMGAKANAIGFVPASEISVFGMLQNAFSRRLLSGIAAECDARSCNLLIISGTEDRKDWAIRNAVVDGFILGHSSEVDIVSVRRRKVPFVVLDVDAGPHVHSISIEAYKGARIAVEHLLALGHRRFAIQAVMRKPGQSVFYPAGENRQRESSYPIDRAKLAGYGDGLRTAGLSLDQVPIVESHTTAENSEEGAKLLCERAPNATAILAMSDTIALAMLKVAKWRGLRVPEDISVIGFDDIPEAAEASPGLTTIAQPLIEKGRLATRMILENAPPTQVVLPVHLVIRGSTGQAVGAPASKGSG